MGSFKFAHMTKSVSYMRNLIQFTYDPSTQLAHMTKFSHI